MTAPAVPLAFVTGAAHGQGRAVALALAADGYDIAALDVAKPLPYPRYALGTEDELRTLEKEVVALGRSAITFSADVRDDAAVTAAVRTTLDRFGGVDVLFNNAGVAGYGARE